MSRRKGKEFSQRTKDRALNQAGLKSGEVHHKCPISIGKRLGVPAWLMTCQANAQAMTEKEHKQLHKETSTKEFKIICQALLGLVQKF